MRRTRSINILLLTEHLIRGLRGEKLTERELAGAALLAFEARPDFQQAIEHFGTFGTARGKLRVSLFVHVLEAVKFVGNVERREDGDFQRVDGECS